MCILGPRASIIANCSGGRYSRTSPLKERAQGIEEDPPLLTGNRHLGEDQVGTTAQPKLSS